MPNISIIIPVYNVEAHLPRCLDSILRQCYTDFEVILINDGSPDGSGDICENYAAQDPRIHVIHQPNSGPSVARNTGIDWVFSHSDSQWLAFIDSDDWVHPSYLSTLYQTAMDTHMPITSCSFVRTEGEEPDIPPEPYPTSLIAPEDFYMERNVNSIVIWGKLYRKEIFRRVRYPAGKIHEDEITTFKVIFSQKQIAFVDVPLYYYYQNPTGIMGSPWSPKRLDSLPALYSHLVFFRRNGYHKTYNYRIRFFFSCANWSLNRVKEHCHPDIRKKHVRMAHHYYRKALRLCRKTGHIPFHTNEHLYEKTYPRLMKLYWTVTAIASKITKGSQ